MIGRNGPDTLYNYLLGIGVTLSVLASFFKITMLTYLSLALLMLALFRLFSKNVYARRQENLKFLQLLYKIKAYFYKIKMKNQQRKIYKFYKCSSCKHELRVPKGKGKIKITCPKCKASFEART